MASSSPVKHAWRVLLGLLIAIGVLFGLNALGVYGFGKSSWTPQLALDLQGGTLPEAVNRACIMIALFGTLDVPLQAPLGDRTVLAAS